MTLRAWRSDQPHGADRRVAENDRRNLLVLEVPFGLAAEEPVAQAPPGGDRHRRERQRPGDVADGVDARHVRILEIVGDDVALRIERDA